MIAIVNLTVLLGWGDHLQGADASKGTHPPQDGTPSL